jgi:hypothetical protein
MRQCTFLLIGLFVLASLSGCCCGPQYGGCGTGGYGSYAAPSGGCWGGACGVSPQPGVVPQGSSYMTYDTYQAGVPVGTPVTAAPMTGYPTVALGPTEALPTYR